MTTTKKKGKKSTPIDIVVSGLGSWAAEMEDSAIGSTVVYKSNIISAQFPTAPRGAFETQFDFSEVPQTPPFKIVLKNLPYEVSVEQIKEFFCNLEVIEIKLPERNIGKAVGTVEFRKRSDLIEALKKNKEKIQNRDISIELAGIMNQGFYNRQIGSNSWRSGQSSNYNDYNNNRSRVNNRRGSDYTLTGHGGNRRYDNDSELRNENQNYGFSDMSNSAYPPTFRKIYSGSVSNDFYGPLNKQAPNKRYGPLTNTFNNEFVPEGGNPSFNLPAYPRSKIGGTGHYKPANNYTYPDRETSSTFPVKRPSLDLKPRTKNINLDDANTPAHVESLKHASIFGAAKPVDTARIEARIEARLLEQQEQSKASLSTNLERRPTLPKIVSRSTSQNSIPYSEDICSNQYEENSNFSNLPHRRSRPDTLYDGNHSANRDEIYTNGPSIRSSQTSGDELNSGGRRLSQSSSTNVHITAPNKYGLISPAPHSPRINSDNFSGMTRHQYLKDGEGMPLGENRYHPKYHGTRSMDYGRESGGYPIKLGNTSGSRNYENRAFNNSGSATSNYLNKERGSRPPVGRVGGYQMVRGAGNRVAYGGGNRVEGENKTPIRGSEPRENVPHLVREGDDNGEFLDATKYRYTNQFETLSIEEGE